MKVTHVRRKDGSLETYEEFLRRYPNHRPLAIEFFPAEGAEAETWPEFLHRALAGMHATARARGKPPDPVRAVSWVHWGEQEDGIELHCDGNILNIGEPSQFRGAHVRHTPELAAEYDAACAKLITLLKADGLWKPKRPKPGAGVNP